MFEAEVAGPLLREAPRMAHLVLAVGLEVARARGLGNLTMNRPRLAAWLAPVADRPSLRATRPPELSP
jgi:hypothetical protein